MSVAIVVVVYATNCEMIVVDFLTMFVRWLYTVRDQKQNVSGYPLDGTNPGLHWSNSSFGGFLSRSWW